MNKIVINNFSLFKKSKIKLMSFLICSSLLSSCNVTHDDVIYEVKKDNNTVSSMDEEQTPVSKNEPIVNEPVISDIDNEIFSQIFSLSDLDVTTLQQDINSISADYLYDDLFQIDEALKEYDKININSKENSNVVIKDNQVNFNEWYQIVCNNNEEYLNENGVHYSNISPELLQKIVHIMVDSINAKLNDSDNAMIDISLLDDTLSHLKVLSYAGFGVGAFNEDDIILAVDLSAISNYQKLHPDLDVLERIVKHETNHCIQSISGSNLKNQNCDINYGICYHFPNLEVNSLYYHFLFEGAAERLAIDDYQDNQDSLFYNNDLMSIESIDLSILLNSNLNSTSLERSLFQHDLNVFLGLFHVENEEDKKEILNMLYAYELINTESDEFKAVFEKNNGYRMNASEMDEYKICLKEGIATTLTKQFYSSLISYLHDSSTSLHDMFELISIFEDEISRITWYISRQDYYQDFFSNYKTIQSDLFQIIASKIGYSEEEIFNSYYCYHSNVEDYHDILNLNTDKNMFLQQMFNSRKSHRKPSISSIIDSYQK